MKDNESDKPVTGKYLLEFTKEIILPAVRDIVKEEGAKFRDEILISNDKLNVKLDKILAEQQAITAGFKRLQERINYLESVVKVLAEAKGIKFNPPQV